MKKIVLFLISFLFPFYVYALETPELYSKKVLVYDLTEEKILFQKDSDKETSIASLTKIMTTIVAIENITDLDNEIQVTSNMLNGIPYYASVAGLKVGDRVTMRDLLYASMLPSGADAMKCLALLLAKNVDSFVDKMNDKAIELNMKNTHFVNITGLDAKGHYSTLEDIMILLKYALKDPLFFEIYTTKEYKLQNGLTVKSTISMYNKAMNLDVSRILGSKTGNTDDAGLCMSAYFKSSEHDMLLLTTGAKYVYRDFYNLKDALTIIKYVDQNFQEIPIIRKNTLIEKIKVKNSKTDFYTAFVKHDITKYLPVDYKKDDVKIVYDGLKEISFKNKKGSKLGTVKYYYQNELIFEEDVILDSDISFDINIFLYENKTIFIGCILGIEGILLLFLLKIKARS